MADIKRRNLLFSSGKQVKLFGNSIAISKSGEIGEGYAPNLFSFFEQVQENKPTIENTDKAHASKGKTTTGVANPYNLTAEELAELADFNIRLWLDFKDNLRRYGVNNPKIFNREL